MNRAKPFVVAGMIALSAVAGLAVAWLVPGAATEANAATGDLKLAPPPPASAAVNVPSFADLAERATPSVVAITSSKMVEQGRDQKDFFDNPFFRRFFRDNPFGGGGDDEENNDAQPQSRDNRRQQPRKEKKMWGGSGFFVTADGYILTNKHVVDGAEELFVRTGSMSQTDEGLKARLVGKDPYLDLALLKVEGRNDWPALPLGDSDRVRVGEWAVAIGNPIMFRNSVTVGVVSGKGRRLDFDPSNLGDYIQTDASINFGNSGGPLLNARGEVIGISTAIIRDEPGTMGGNGYIQGIGFALPISAAKKVLNQLAGTGTVKRGYLGVSVQAMDPERADYLGAPKGRGAYVARVDKGTPADKAGVKADDIILAVDGKAVNSSEELVNEVSAHSPGEKIRLTLWREKRETDVVVTLAERKVGTEQEQKGGDEEATPDETAATALGFSVGPLPQALRDRLSKMDPPVKGILITDVDPSSAAAAKGLAAGLILLEINNTPTPTADAYRKAAAAVQPGSVVKLRVLDRSGDEFTLFFRAPNKK